MVLAALYWDMVAFLNPFLTELVYRVARKVCRNLAYYLPRNTNLDQVSWHAPSPVLCIQDVCLEMFDIL